MVTFALGPQENLEEVLASSHNLVKAYGGNLVDQNTRDFRAGEILALDSVTLALIPRKSTQLRATAADGQAVLDVDDPHNFAVGDVITAGDATGTYIILSIVGNLLTLTTNLTGGTNPLPLDARVHDAANNRNTGVAIAITPMKDRAVPTVGNSKGDDVYGDAAIRGMFLTAKLKDFNSEAITDFGSTTEINGVTAIL